MKMLNRLSLYSRWDALREQLASDAEADSSYRAYFSCPFGYTYISLDIAGNENLMLVFPENILSDYCLPKVYGLSFSKKIVPNVSKEKPCLVIGLSPDFSDVKEAFEAFSVTLIGRLSQIEHPIDALNEISEVCTDYADFFKKGNKNSFSIQQEQGLFGELLILQETIKKIGESAVAYWTGPEKNRHDFSFENKAAFEVKTSLKQGRRIVTISNDVQLNNIDDCPLFLVLYILEANPSGLTVSDLASSIYDSITDFNYKKDFERKLLEIGFVLNSTETSHHFCIIDRFNYLVDASFPRLTNENIRNISQNIFDVKYKINLDGYDTYSGDIYEFVRA